MHDYEASLNERPAGLHALEANAESPVPEKIAKARKRQRISAIDLEIAHLAHEKATLRAELAAK